MTVFRTFQRGAARGSDRSVRDRKRHKEKVKEAIKQNIQNIISEESIIGQSGDKRIKIPIRGIKEYQFIFGHNNPDVGTGNGQAKPGDVVQKGNPQNEGIGPAEPGNRPGDDVYETEITLEEAISYLFEDLELPDLERKRFHIIESERLIKPKGVKHLGIRPRLNRRWTMKEHIRRKIASHVEEEERFPFHDNDLRYNRIVVDIKEHSNAVVFCVMDTSGSMDITKKYLARSFYFLLYQFVHRRYQNVELVFIAHHTEAKEVTENEFFHRGESGGTMISSGYRKALEIIKERYHPSLWNIYAFHCSDGDNFTEDNQEALRYAKELKQICNLFGYGEIKPFDTFSWGSMMKIFEPLATDNFVILGIRSKEDVWPALKKFLSRDRAKVRNEG
jgi:sporulation protein YhbH